MHQVNDVYFKRQWEGTNIWPSKTPRTEGKFLVNCSEQQNSWVAIMSWAQAKHFLQNAADHVIKNYITATDSFIFLKKPVSFHLNTDNCWLIDLYKSSK